MSEQPHIKNRKASFEYEFIEKYVAGIILKGTEVKSIREGKASLQEAFCFFNGHELWIKNMHVQEYKFGSYNNPDPKRDRKLLLGKKELLRLKQKSEEKGLTIIPLQLFFNARGFAKIEIALARGKKLYDKRASKKEKDLRREMQRGL